MTRDRRSRQPRGRAGRTSITDHDRARLRTTRRIAVAGPVLGAAGAAAVGLLGASGRAGMSVVLLLSAAGCVAAAVVTSLQAVWDEHQEHPVASTRALAVVVLLVGAVLLLVMAGSLAVDHTAEVRALPGHATGPGPPWGRLHTFARPAS